MKTSERCITFTLNKMVTANMQTKKCFKNS